MSTITYDIKRKENNEGDKKGSVDVCSSDEVVINPKSKAQNPNPVPPKKPLKTWIKVLIIIAVLGIVGVIAAIIIPKIGNKNSNDPIETTPNDQQTYIGEIQTKPEDEANPGGQQSNPEKQDENHEERPINPGEANDKEENLNNEEENIIYTVDKLKEVLKPNFKINSKVNSITRTTMKSKRNVVTKNNNVSDYTFIKAKVDAYIVSESLLESNEGTNFYEKKIKTCVVINSLCAIAEGSDCQYSTYLELNVNSEDEDEDNQRNLDDDFNIEELTFPVCLIEHTETNIILSITCPRNLESNLKQIIIDTFESIKPKTIANTEENKTLADTTIEKRENKIYIKSFSKICEDNNDNKICLTNLDIITDKDGNFISSNRLLKTETDSFSNEYYIDISPENGGNLDPNVYKANLDKLFNLIGTYMEKETYIQINTIEEIINEAKQLRHLDEEVPNGKGKQEKNIFCTEYGTNNVCLSLSDNILKGNGDESETTSNINFNGNISELSSNKVSSNLTSNVNEFKAISNAANSLVTILFNKIINPLTDLGDKINSEFTAIDNLLAFRDLSSVYDSTFVIKEMNEFPYTIVSAAKNIYSNIKNINDDLIYSIDDTKSILKNSITSFLTNSHNLMNTIFNRLKELTSALSSTKSKIANIASFYGLNNTNISFIFVVEKADEILANYYIEEKKIIDHSLNDIFDNFLNVSNEIIKNSHYTFENITNRLEDESVVINNGDENDIKIVIDNLYNVALLEKQIPANIVELMKKNIIQSNGYYVTQRFIEDNNNSFIPIRQNALSIARIIDNCEYNDAKFDEIMKYFREQLIVILNNMEKSKIENFPIKTNVLDNSNSLNNSMFELDDFFKNEKLNINNLVKNENKNVMNLIQQKINSFLENDGKQLGNIINNIDNILSKLNLSNIDKNFNEMLTYTENNITNIIKDNNNLLLEYMNDIKSTTHLTETIITKVDKFTSRRNEIKNYISSNLKNDLIHKYKNIINQIRNNLQTIKSNSFINQYNTQKDLSFLKNHINDHIDPLFSQLDDYISDKIFNTKYLPIINNIINNFISTISSQANKFNELYQPIKKKSKMSDNNNDIYYKSCSKCCVKYFWFICIKRSDKYSGKKVSSSSNINKIKDISFSSFTKDFDNYNNNINSILSKNISSYNNIISILDNQLKIIMNDYSNKEIDYLNSLTERIKSFLNEHLGTNILQLSYNYYKNDLNEKLPVELNSILGQWKSVYNKVYQDINSNINKFKYPIGAFSNLATIYYYTYYSNISYFYSDSVIEQRKSDFNYTIKYYYNYFLSKVNKTYSYIINNMPKNEKPFDCLLNNQIKKIKNSYNEILNLFSVSQSEILNIKKQLNTFKVSETNFFEANSFAINIQDTIEEELYPLVSSFEEISYMVNNKFDSEESLAINFYLENLINGKQINDLYNSINKGTFIDFQINGYQNLFEDILEIDEIDLKNKISDFLVKSKEELTHSFESKKAKYKNMLQNEIFNKFYDGKNGLEQKINSLYSEGLNDLDIDSKNKILKLIDDIVESIKNHMTNEKSRLANELTSYSNNYNVFTQRLDKLENEIFNKFYTVIVSLVNNFNSDIKQKFYTNYIEKYLDEYYNNTIKEKFSNHTFLNFSFDLKEIMDKNIESLTSEYKKWALDQLVFLYDKKIQDLNKLFSINTLKSDIKTKIDKLYNTILMNTLKEKAIYISGNEGIEDYDFSETIMNSINTVINEKINQAKNIIEKMKGNKFNIEEDWARPDFSQVKRLVFKNITDEFNNFCEIFDSKEKQDFKKEISTNINNNFKQIIDNFVPSFGKDFFERILKFNEMQKIKSLYQNLKFSLGVSLLYYMFLTESSAIKLMPEDLEIKILALNNIDSIINLKNKDVLSKLNSKFDEFLGLTKNQLIEKYINYLKNDITLKTSFSDNIMDLVKVLLENNRYIYEDEYISMMNSFIKNPFIEQYSNAINEATKDMINYVEENRESLKLDLKDLLIMNKDETLNNIETKLNDTLEAIDKYKSNFESFSIPQDIKNFLDNYVSSNILSVHQEIKTILDEKTKNLILNYLNISSEDFKKAYAFENIESKLNDINSLFKNQYFDKMIQYLKEYGIIDSTYMENLEKALINNVNSSMRILEDNGELPDLKLDKTFTSLMESSHSNKQYIQNVNIFSNFLDKISNYTYNIKEQYEVSKTNIKNRKYTEEVNEQLYQNLEDLKELSISYYDKVKIKYEKIKEYIESSISNIHKLFEKSHDITYTTIKDKYQAIKNNYNSINDIVIKEENNIQLKYNKENYNTEITINNFIYNNKFIFEMEEGKLRGKSINKNRPSSLVVDFSSKIGKCVLKGKEMTINLNNFSSILDLDYDVGSTETKIIKKFNLSEYTIDNKFYNETEKIVNKKIGGIIVPKLMCARQIIPTPDGEKEKEVIEAKDESTTETL